MTRPPCRGALLVLRGLVLRFRRDGRDRRQEHNRENHAFHGISPSPLYYQRPVFRIAAFGNFSSSFVYFSSSFSGNS